MKYAEKISITSEELRRRALECLSYSEDMGDEEIKGVIEREAWLYLRINHISIKLLEAAVKLTFNSMRRLDILQDFLEDEDVTEIMVNGWDSVFIEKENEVIKSERTFQSKERLYSIIQSIVGEINRVVNEKNPIADARLKDGSRVNIVLPPIAINGPIVTIRKFKEKNFTLEDLVKINSITKEAMEMLKIFVVARYNIFICGGTDTGKTTLLNALSNCIGEGERIITIEDLAELRLNSVKNIVSLEARETTLTGDGKVSIRDLIKSALRMRPDRIIVGEVRDSAVIDLMNAYNTGHDGSISSGHSNSSRDMITRLVTMYLMGIDLPEKAIKKQIASAIDVFIHLGRDKNNKRIVLSIDEVIKDFDEDVMLNSLFVYDYKKGKLIRTANPLLGTEKMERLGIEYKEL